MNKRLLRYFLPLLLLIGFITLSQRGFAQTPTFASLSGGITPNSGLGNGTSQYVIYGFSVTVSSGSNTFKQYMVGMNTNNANTYLTNGTLFRSPTSTFNPASPGVAIGNVTFGTGTITIDSFTETFTGPQTNYYFLVVDPLYSGGGGYMQPYNNNTAIAVDANGTSYNSGFSVYRDYNLTTTIPYPLSATPITNTSGGLTASTTVLTSGTNGLVLYEVAVTNNLSSGSYTFSDINFASNVSNLGQYFSGFSLYVNTSNSLPGSSSATTTSSTANVSFTGLSQTLAAGATKYYYLVANCSVTGTLPVNVQFRLVNGTTSFKSSSPSVTNFADFTAPGNTYNINYTSLSVTSQQNGVSANTMTAHQTGLILFGFGVTSSGAVTLSGFNINSNGPASSYFTNGKLYRNNTNTYPSSSPAPVQVGTVTFTGNYAVVTGLTETFTAGQTRYYFLVADNSGGGSSATIAFNFTSGQSNSAVTQSAPAASTYNTFAVTGNTYNLPSPNVYTVSANSPTLNGVATGALYYGRKDIVVFGFGVEAYGAAFTFNASSVKVASTASSASSYFSNIRLYRSASPEFPGGTATYNSSNISDCNCGFYRLASATESIPINTTYYYFLVVDYTNSGGTAPASITYSFASSQSGFDSQVTRASPFNTYNPGTFSGPTLNIVDTEDWTGGTNGNLGTATNYALRGGAAGSGFVPTGSTIVRIGSMAYTNAPVVNSSLTIGGLAIENSATVNLSTSANNNTLTLNNGLTIATGSTLNYTTTFTNGKIALVNGAISYIEPTGKLNLTGNTSIDNTANTTGSFILESDATSTATIGALPSTASLTGTYVVQRYFTGGSLAYRGYRLMGSPVQNGTTHIPAVNTDTYNFSSLKTNLFITGTGGSGAGFDQPSGYTANGPTILFYTPTNATNGTFTSPAAPTSTAKIGSGFYFYFRGDNTTNAINKVIKSGTYATPEANVVGLQSGILNQQSFNYALSTIVGGYNLLGNPYPSAISINQAALTNTNNTVYTYTPGGASITAHSVTSTPWIVASGQGFFVKSTTAAGTVAFSESLKTTTQPALLLGTPATMAEGNIKLQLVQDSANYDMAELRFMDSYKKEYVEQEDADDLNGSGQVVFFGAMTADNHLVAITSQPFEKQTTSIYLSVNDNTSGTFKINKVELSNIPDKYDVWLIDHFKIDSIDMRANSSYIFTMDKTNPATYGNSRMEVVIRKKVLPPYKLLTFTGVRISTKNILAWTTQNESLYTYFELERSFDGKTYEGLNNSTSTGAGKYTFTDPTTKPLVYYRLKQTDINDVVTYSTIVILKSDDKFNILTVYPNPTSDKINFTVSQEVKTSVTLRVSNSLGTLMKSAIYNSNSGNQDVSTLPPGSYVIELVDNGSKKLIASAKFIKL